MGRVPAYRYVSLARGRTSQPQWLATRPAPSGVQALARQEQFSRTHRPALAGALALEATAIAFPGFIATTLHITAGVGR
jgi:hypothetical protein